MLLAQILTDEFDLTMLLRPPRARHVDTLHGEMTFNQLVAGPISIAGDNYLNNMRYLQIFRLGESLAFSGQVPKFSGLDSSI